MSVHPRSLELSRLNRAYVPPKSWPRTRLHEFAEVEHVNPAAISGSGKLPAHGIKRERGNNHSCWYAVAHVTPCQSTIGAGKNARIGSGEDMFRICRIDRHVLIDEVGDSLLNPGCSHVGSLIHT